MNEAKFKTWLVTNLKKLGYFVQTIETTTGRGVPDLVALKNGKTCWLELKCVSGPIIVRPEQYSWGLRAHKAGVDVSVVNYNEDDKRVEICKHPMGTEMVARGWKVHPYMIVQRKNIAFWHHHL
jgi:hypothetical protein